MNQLATDLKSHVIITFTKSHHFITQKQHDSLINMGQNAQIIVDGNLIKTSNIAEIISTAKYYETYPEKRSTNYGQPYSEVPGNVFTRAGKNGRERFLTGLRRTAPNSALLRNIELGIGVVNRNTYEPKFRFEKEGEGDSAKFSLKPVSG